MKQIKTGNLTRYFNLDRTAIDEEARTVGLSFSSDAPVERWFGMEVLDHSPKSVDLGRLNDGAPLLMDHDTSDQIGRVESATVDGKRGQAIVRFSKSVRAQEIFTDVMDGIRQNISVGYRINEMELDESRSEDEVETYVATRWQPFEVSVVSVPADNSIGIARSADGDNITKITNLKTKNKEVKMTTENTTNIDAATVARDAVAADRARSQEIDAIVAKHPELKEIGSQFKGNDRSMDEFRGVALDSITKNQPTTAAIEDTKIGMSDKEADNFSIVRAVNALVTGNWNDAGFEREMSDSMASKLGKRAQGFYIPTDVLMRDLNVTTATAGGHTVATDLLSGSFIDMLRNKMATVGLGATMMTDLVGNIAIPRQTGGATSYWVAESGAITESQAAFDQVSMSPKTVGSMSDISRKMLLQSSMDVESFVRNDLATSLALAIDSAAINGSGASNQPTGILNTSGIGSVVGGTNGAAPDWADIVDLESAVAIDNADMGALGFLTNAATRGKLLQTEKASGTAQYVWSDSNTLRGYNAAVSNQVPSNGTKGTGTALSSMVFGNWNDLIIGTWGGIDINVDTSTGSASGTVRVVALQDVDIAVRHAESFAAMTDIIT
jgi:HK97 family phage major capsid protein/HK97 family phage prohead protease